MTATPELTAPTGQPNYIVAVNPEARSQAQRRRDRNARDQHGRVWLITLERVKSPRGEEEYDICGGPPCSAGFGDPLHTPAKYFRLSRDEFGEVAQNRLKILYPEWIEEQTTEDQRWYDFFWAIAALKFPGGIEAEAALKHPWLLQLAGPRPWPRPSLIRLAADGHEGFLGLRPLTPQESALLGRQVTVDDLLQEFLHRDNPTLTAAGTPVTVRDVGPVDAPLTAPEALTYKDFFQDGRKQGLSVSEIARNWRTHRAAVEG